MAEEATMSKFTRPFSTRPTPPSNPAAGDCETRAAGPGGLFDDWQRLDRFLVLGSEAGSYHTARRQLTIERAGVVSRCLAADGLRTIDRIVAVSGSGRAPRNEPAIFSLAMAAKLGDEATRRAAYAALPTVCRLATHLMQFAHHAQSFGGWGRGMRKAVSAWFNGKSPVDLAYQLARYPARDGWSNRDLLRLAHPRAASPSHDRLFAWAVTGELARGGAGDPALALMVALAELAAAPSPAAAAALIRDHRIPRECVSTAWLEHAEVWEALLAAMPLTTMIRHLAVMTRVGLVAPNSAAAHQIAAQLRDPLRLCKSRVHPIAMLAARLAYEAGRGVPGAGTWEPVPVIVEALDAAFYACFHAADVSGKRTLIAIDVSGSMASGSIAGVPDLSPRLAAAAMALVTAATEREPLVAAFTQPLGAGTGGHGSRWGGGTSDLTTLALSPCQRLGDVVGQLDGLAMGGVDCAVPMLWAKDHRVDVETFCVYTDNETWAGDVHPAQALRAYREARGIPAKLVVVGMTSTGFSLADPDDAGMLDVVGFDASAPPVIADFARA